MHAGRRQSEGARFLVVQASVGGCAGGLFRLNLISHIGFDEVCCRNAPATRRPGVLAEES
jgi:hypothetical protein